MIIKGQDSSFQETGHGPFKYKNRLTWQERVPSIEKEKLRIENISFQYPGAATYALKDVSFSLYEENGYLLLDKTVQESLHLQNY